jgi:UDP-2,3-diacylglucosamine pyrophosphatase LpxH
MITKIKRRPLGHAPLRSGCVLEGDSLFLSDIHLFEPDDQQTRLVLDLLASIGPGRSAPAGLPQLSGIRHLFFLGDIFEFIDASVAYFRQLWRSFFDALVELKSRGVQIYMIEGNHDFGFESLSHWTAFAGDAGLDFTHSGLQGLLHVRHGDDVVCDRGYLVFREFVKSAPATRLLRLLPAGPAHRFFLKFAKLSREAGSQYALTLPKIQRDVERFLLMHPGAKPELMIIGHIHVHLDTVVNGVRVVAGPDWHNAPSVLLLTADGELQRCFVNPDRTVPLLT